MSLFEMVGTQSLVKIIYCNIVDMQSPDYSIYLWYCLQSSIRLQKCNTIVHHKTQSNQLRKCNLPFSQARPNDDEVLLLL